jgi:hypothetical protein
MSKSQNSKTFSSFSYVVIRTNNNRLGEKRKLEEDMKQTTPLTAKMNYCSAFR